MTNTIMNRDTPEQCDMFDQYLYYTAELEGRQTLGKCLGYDEVEWEAFQYGWNSAKVHFGITT